VKSLIQNNGNNSIYETKSRVFTTEAEVEA